jgi:hypothetical protein
MPGTVTPPTLTLQLLEWVAAGGRSYGETMDAWSSWCPRHSVWEDALAEGLVRVARREVTLTARGRELLAAA